MTGNARSGHRQLRVVAKTPLADGVVGVQLAELDGGPVPEWRPGAHIDLVLDGSTTRQYSLCGDPDEFQTLEVAVLRETGGRGGSVMVHDKVTVGDLLEISEPRNHFGLVEATSYLFVAGGIGITPLIPMMREVSTHGVPWRLLYGGRNRATMAFADELLRTYPESVTLRPQDEFGHLDLAAAIDDLAPDVTVYCCGPEPLLVAIEKVCADRPAVDLHVERFAPKQVISAGPDRSFVVTLERSGTTVEVGASESIIDAVQRVGVNPDFSCREGTCGTCEVAVLKGTPDHRDSVLTADEQAENDAMMICVSRSRTPEIVLDL